MSKRRDPARKFRVMTASLGCGLALLGTAAGEREASAQAQAQAQAQPLLTKPRRATAAYFGDNVVNPGATLGYEAAFYYRRPHELFGGAHIGGYNSADPPY